MRLECVPSVFYIIRHAPPVPFRIPLVKPLCVPPMKSMKGWEYADDVPSSTVVLSVSQLEFIVGRDSYT